MDKVPDNILLKKVNERLQRAGSGTSRVTATVRSGTVTLIGALQYEIQRRPMVKAATSTAGVMRVVDQMTVAAKKKVM